MSAALPSPDSLNLMHGEIVARGWKLLQPFRYGHDDEAHIRLLLNVADFPHGAKVLDVGCGVGECAKMMQAQRPDLNFVLLNFSSAQLADCPDGFETVEADAHRLPFEEGEFDAVMFNASLGNMDCMVALAEAGRVLRPGGILFLNELCRVSGNNADLEEILRFRAYDSAALCKFVEQLGFCKSEVHEPFVAKEYLRGHLSDGLYERAFKGVIPMLWRFTKSEISSIACLHGSIFYRHERVALQLSGGKDSLAALYAMRPWWDRLCVYWVNPGDPFPETVDLMRAIREMVPYFVEVAGHQRSIVAAHGWPSDIVPIKWTTSGQFVFGELDFKVQGRLDCCWHSLMLPLHQRMIKDEVTCVIRGKRSEEKDKSPSRTGSVFEGIETVYPLWDWKESDVFEYLNKEGAELPESYSYATHSLDCMSCTAWWGEGLEKYLEAKHPVQYAEYLRRIHLIKTAIRSEIAQLEV